MDRIFVLLHYVRFRFFESRIWFYADTFFLTKWIMFRIHRMIWALLNIYSIMILYSITNFWKILFGKRNIIGRSNKMRDEIKKKILFTPHCKLFVSGGIWMNEMITHMYHVHVQCLDLFLSYLKYILKWNITINK